MRDPRPLWSNISSTICAKAPVKTESLATHASSRKVGKKSRLHSSASSTNVGPGRISHKLLIHHIMPIALRGHNQRRFITLSLNGAN